MCGAASDGSPRSISPATAGSSVSRPSRTSRSSAYQSLHASPIAPACGDVERADAVLVDHEAVGEAVGVLVPDRRGVVAVVVELRQLVQVLEQIQLQRRRLAVGRRVHVRVVDVVDVRPAVAGGVGAVERLRQHRVLALEVAGRGGRSRSGPEARWSWNLLTRKKASVAALLAVESASSSGRSTGSHAQMWCGVQRGGRRRSNGVNVELEVAALGRDLLRRLGDVVVVDVGPGVRVRAGQVGRAVAGSQPGVVRSWLRSVPPSGAPR